MKRLLLAAGIICAIMILPAPAAEISPMADVWTNAGYHSTNGERPSFNSFNLRSEGKFGLRISDGIPGTGIEPYVAYYGVASQDPNYWNNELSLGGGLRIFPFLGYQGRGWADEWLRDVKFFAESLNLTVLNDRTTAINDKIATTDSRFGADVWHEWNLKDIDANAPWAEVWGNFSHRQTNLTNTQFDTWLVYLQTKYGSHLSGGIRPYLASYLTYSGAPQPWYNNWYYGVGLRMEPFLEQKDPPELLRKFKMFLEVLGIAWLKEPTTRPTAELVFGIETTFGR
jgi:hypothetical protein